MAADLTAPVLAGLGGTVALWGGSRADRPLSQAWAAALFASGRRALYHGVQHNPTGTGRGITLLDDAGSHRPTHGSPWEWTVHTLHDDIALQAELRVFGIKVIDDPDPLVVALDDLGS